MRFLLDTHLMLWHARGDSRLAVEAVELICDEKNDFSFSVASLWEIAIKQALGRADFNADAAFVRRAFRDRDFEEVPIRGEHVLAIRSLPPLHKDPFDRILIAQAAVEGLVLLTADRTVARYPGPIRQV